MTDATIISSPALKAAMLAGLALSPTCAQADGLRAEADGIVAQMWVAADGVRVGWRFLRPPPARIASVSVRADEALLPPPNGPVAAFPAPGQTAVVQYLSARGSEAAPGLAAAGLPAGVTVRTTRLAPSSTGNPEDGLAEAIGRALDDLGGETANRRAILLFLDGPGLASGPALEAAARARQQDTPVFVALGRQASPTDHDAALRFAEAARGAVLDGSRDLATQLDYTALSGAELSFPYSVGPRLPWQGRSADLRAEIDYGGRSLALHAAVDRPAADSGEIAAALWDASRPQLPGFCVGAALAAAVGSAIWAGATLAGGRRS